MKQSEKLKVLIDSIKTANDLMRKQIEINGRAVELLGEFITEPEQVELETLGKTPLTSTLARVAEKLGIEVKGEYQEIPIGVVGKDGKVEHFIKPEDMKAGEWYLIKTSGNRFLIKFNWIHNDQIIYFKGWSFYTNWYLSGIPLCNITYIKSIRSATQQEILRYFPNELEVPTHGGNDAAYI